MKIHIKKSIVALSIVTLAAGSAHAALIIQQNGSDDIKFEAGSYDSIVNDLGNSEVFDNLDGTLTTTVDTSFADPALVTYQIDFATAGNYFLYFNVTAPSAADDSVFVNHGSGFDSIPGNTNDERWNGLDTGWNGLYDIGVGLGIGQGNYNIPAGTPNFAWNVASPGTVSFTVRAREDGLTWNSFVFSTSDVETATALDGLAFSNTAIPEPSSTALLGLGSFALILRRRR